MIVKLLFLLFGLAVTANGILALLTSNFNLGIVLTLLLGAALLLFGFFLPQIPRLWRVAFCCLLLLTVLSVSLLLGCGLTDNVNHQEDAVIVLGAAIHGERPSGVLRDRLDVAFKYLQENPHAVVVVTGGQGAQETITEALAMERYLLHKGITADRIIREDNATSTEENFRFSKALLDSRFGKDHTACFVTNEYHIYRSAAMAQQAGYTDMTHLHSNTKWYSVLPGTLRECLAVLKLWIF